MKNKKNLIKNLKLKIIKTLKIKLIKNNLKKKKLIINLKCAQIKNTIDFYNFFNFNLIYIINYFYLKLNYYNIKII